MKKYPYPSVFLPTIALFVFFLLFPIGVIAQNNKSTPPETPWTLTFKENQLSADIKKKPLHDVLTELAKQTNLPIDVEGSISDETVSAVFDPIPLEEGLNALLRHKNYILIYSEALPTSESNAGNAKKFTVEGIQIAGKGRGGAPGEKYRIMPPPPPPSYEVARPDRPKMNDERIIENRQPGLPLSPFHPNRPPLPRQDPGTPQERLQEPGNVNRNIPSIPRQEFPAQTAPPPSSSQTAEEQVDDLIDELDDLYDNQGRAAIPRLQEIAHSHPSEEVRDHAQFLIEDLQSEEE